MIDMPIWAEYIVIDDDGLIVGLSEDAPEEAKEAYAKMKAEEQAYIDKGEKIPR